MTDKSSKRSGNRQVWLAYFILITGILSSLLGYFALSKNLQYKRQQSFETAVQEIESGLRTRMEAYIALLRGGAGLFAVNKWVTAGEFHAYVDRLRVQEFYPGIQGIGLAVKATKEDESALVENMRQQGFHDFKIRSDRAPQDVAYPIVYLEPWDGRNLAAIGFDMFSQPERRVAMEQARDLGEPIASETVTLVQEIEGPKQPGFLIYVPVYSGPEVPRTIEERRASIEAFVYSPFRAHDLLRSVLDEAQEVASIEVFDGTQADPDKLLYKSDRSRRIGSLQKVNTLEIAGHPWLLRFSAPPSSATVFARLLPIFPLLGILLSLVLFYLLRSEAVSRRRLEVTASELGESEARFRALFEQAAVGIEQLALDGTFVGTNAKFSEILGYSRHELLGKNFRDLTEPSDLSREEQLIADMKAGKCNSYVLEKRYISKDGRHVWVSVTSSLVRKPVAYRMSVVEDITERKRSEQALRESETRFRMFFEQAPLGIQSFSPQGDIIEANDAWERLWQTDRKQLEGYNILLDPQLKARGVLPQIRKAFGGERVDIPGLSYDPAEIGRAGHKRWVDLYLYPVIRNSHVSEVVLILQDVTDRKAAEEAAAASSHQLQTIADTVPVLIGAVDTSLRYEFNNLLYEQWFNLPRNSIRGRKMVEVIGPAAFDKLSPLIQKALRGEPVSFELHVPFATGTRYIAGDYVPKRDAQGIVTGFFSFMVDLSERKRSEDASRFVAEAAKVLGEALDFRQTLPKVADLAVPLIADWCGVDLVKDGKIDRMTTVHSAPAEPSAIHNLLQQFPTNAEDCPLFESVLATGKPELVEELSPDLPGNDLWHAWADLGIESVMFVPIRSRDRVYGVMSFATAQSNRRFSKKDLTVAEELASRVGLAVDNALLYEEARREIEERRIVEQALRESEERFRLIVERARDYAIFLTDIEGRVTNWNPGAERILGYTENEVLGQHSRIFFTEEDQANGEPEKEIHGAASSGQALDERWHQRKDGSLFFCSGYMIALHNSEGQLRGFAKIMRDITERKQIEEELRDTAERMRAILETAAEGIISIDENGIIEMMNQAAETIFGYLSEEAIGQNVSILMPSPDRERHDGYMNNYKETGHGKIIGSGREVIGLRKDGTLFPLHLSISEVRLANKRLFTGFVQDITERKKAEEEIRKLNEELEDRVRRRTAELRDSYEQMEMFTYSVAHDLRAPLRAMQGFAQALLEDYAPSIDKSGQDFISRIMRASKRMDTLIQDLLTYSQLTRSDLRFEPIDLEASIGTALNLLNEEIQSKGATVEVEHPLPSLLGHRATLETAITNLVGNAVKFVGAGTRPRVHIRAERTSKDGAPMVRVWFEDNGIGIPSEYQDRIFRIFERLHGVESYAGTGIGLALVKRGIERMGGRVGVESEQGKGSRFWIELPQARQITPRSDHQ